MSETSVFFGHTVSSGAALGPVFLMQTETHSLSLGTYCAGSKEDEWKKVESAFTVALADLGRLEKLVREEMGAEKAEIFSAHKMIVEDPEASEQIKAQIFEEDKNALEATQFVFDLFVEQFSGLDDEYLRERALDVKDVKGRLLAILAGTNETNRGPLVPSIVVAQDITPSEFASFDKKMLLGIATELGGATSHTAIMARIYNIPALVGVKGVVEKAQSGEPAALDTQSKSIVLKPDPKTVEKTQSQIRLIIEEKKELAKLKDVKPVTRDGIKINLKANMGRTSDLDAILAAGAEGVGLFRTEFLFLEKQSPPSEQEQFEVYKKVLSQVAPHTAIIRTLDVGGDKQIPYLNIPKEDNPFLGLRAIRYCLEEKTIFKTQLRALLRASQYGSLSIMFPMIATYEEVLACKQVVKECKQELISEGVQVAPYKVGIMIEIPSAAVIADQLATQVDFFSIGTNDLIQYVCAADRMNESVAHLYQPLNPAVLRLLKFVFEAAEKNHILVSMCGEMASDRALIPLLVGMGLRDFSQSPSAILKCKKEILTMDVKKLTESANQILKLRSLEEISKAVAAFR
ncbi:MAG: phosphoenolpyruvate--protein phosphotransferase [Pseudobdellovibrionaceae bacterium]